VSKKWDVARRYISIPPLSSLTYLSSVDFVGKGLIAVASNNNHSTIRSRRQNIFEKIPPEEGRGEDSNYIAG
jgi:hypothetical protein